jgi:hypothetical protein
MLFKTGRFLQLLGLIIVPVGMAGNIAEKLTLGQMLAVCAAGMLVFFTGWLLQQATRPPG